MMKKVFYKIFKSFIFSITIIIGITYLLFIIGIKVSSISVDTDIHYNVLRTWISGSEKRKIYQKIQKLKAQLKQLDDEKKSAQLQYDEILTEIVIAHTQLKQGSEAISAFEKMRQRGLKFDSIAKSMSESEEAGLRSKLRSELQYALACAYFYKGDTEKSLKLYKAYLNKYPDLLSANLNYASIFISTRRDLDDAFMRAKRMVELYPDCPVTYFRVGQALVAKKKYSDSIVYLNKVEEFSDKATIHKARNLIDQIHNNGLDQTYRSWLFKTLKGDFGYSPTAHLAIKDELFERLKKTLALTVGAVVISIVLAFPIGLFSAYRPYSIWASITRGTVYVFSGIPVFLLGYLAYQVFQPRPETLAYGFLMALCLAFGNGLFSQISKLTIQEVKEIINKNFIIAVRARHANEFVHLMKNLTMPIFTIIATRFPLMLSGTIIVEYIFNYRGVGSWILDAAQKQDFPVLLTSTGSLVFFVLLFNLIKEICHAFIDVRLAND